MSKVAVVYWSGTGNTEAMAMAVAEGVKGKGDVYKRQDHHSHSLYLPSFSP